MGSERSSGPDPTGLSRRTLLAGGVSAGAALAIGAHISRVKAAGGSTAIHHLDFGGLPDGPGWGSVWNTVGVANLHRVDGLGVLEAGSDVFPCDPRPVAFALDRRFRDGAVTAVVERPGDGPGVVLRRQGPKHYYAAIYRRDQAALVLVRRFGDQLDELAREAAVALRLPLTLRLQSLGRFPTRLVATLATADGVIATSSAEDSAPELQQPGDPGVLASAHTFFPGDRNPVVPALGNIRLLPWAIQEGQAVMATPVGQAVVEIISERSTTAFSEIVVESSAAPQPTRPSVIAVTTGAPLTSAGRRSPCGANLHVATDVPARVSIELAENHRFRGSRIVDAGGTGDFHALTKAVTGLRPAVTIYWRVRLRRRGFETLGPVRSFRTPPLAGSPRPVTLAIGSCGSQFGPIFDHLTASRPDIFIWQGDLNYADANGPLAQTMSGYAGMWREFLANPRLAPLLDRTTFVAQRDDHDYGVQDARGPNIPPWGWHPGMP